MICLVLNKLTLEEDISLIKEHRPFVDIVELRIDYLNSADALQAASFPDMTDLPVILTCRRADDGGQYRDSEKARLALLERALDGNFAYVDIEEDVKRSVCVTKAQQKGMQVIRLVP